MSEEIKKITSRKRRTGTAAVWSRFAAMSLGVKIAVIAVVAAAVVAAYIWMKKMFFSYISTEAHSIVSEQLLKCQELSAVKYNYEDVVVKEENSALWLLVPAHRTERLFVRVAVNVRAGIKDMRDIWFAISSSSGERNDEVLVVIPPCVILESGISKQEPLLEVRNLKTKISLDDLFDEINSKHIEIVGQTLQDGILLNAAEHSRTIITNLLKAAGFKKVTVLCDGADKENEESIAAYRMEAERELQEQDENTAMEEGVKRQHSIALYRLGRALLRGEGTKKDEAEGVKYLQMASNEGNGSALRELAICYLHGTGVEKDGAAAVQLFDKAIDAGCDVALADAAICRLYGTGCEKDEHSAFELLQKADNTGDKIARRYLGLYYLLGLGNVDRDEYKATGYIKPVSDGGDAESMTWMALCYLDGKGVYKNMGAKDRYGEAISLLRQAAEGGYKDAFFPLAICYADGTGVKKDYDTALRWLEKAAGDKTLDTAWHKDAAAMLGMFYYNGWGSVKKDKEKAASLGYDPAGILGKRLVSPVIHTDMLLSIRRANGK